MFEEFSVRRALGGGFIGVIVAVLATMRGETRLWWLAVPVLAIVFGFDGGGGSDSDSGWFGGGDSDSGGGDGDGD